MDTQMGENVLEIIESDAERVTAWDQSMHRALAHWGGWSSQLDSERTELQPEPVVFCGIWSTQILGTLWKTEYILSITSVSDLNGKEIGASVNWETSFLQPNLVSSHCSSYRNAEGKADRFFLVSNIMFWFKKLQALKSYGLFCFP